MSRLHISYRNLTLAEEIESACWRELARMADLQGIEHCHLRIETVAWNGANSASSIKQGQQITQIHLKFRIRGIDREITGEPINHNGSGVPGNMLLAALRSAIDRAELPPAARGINRGSQRPARW